MTPPPRSASPPRPSRESGPWPVDGSGVSWTGTALRDGARASPPDDAARGVERQVSRLGDAERAGESAPMTPERWRQMKAVVQQALERPEDARAAFVAEA